MTDFAGRIDSVYTRQFSAILEGTVPAGATLLTVMDAADLDTDGQIVTPWDDEVYDYTFDGEATVTLGAPLNTEAADGETLVVWDAAKAAPVSETVAHVAVLGGEDDDDIVEARVSFPLIPLLAEGIRADGEGEAVTVRQDQDGTYVVAEIIGEAATLTDDFISEVIVPEIPIPAPSDGNPPASHPAVVIRPGVGSLFLVWEPVDNADLVTYDIYAVPAADAARLAAPPTATDLVASTESTAGAIRALPGGTLLSPDASYAVAVYARDMDGVAPGSAPTATGSPAQINSPDIATGAVTVDHLTANDALFIALQAQDIEGVNITGSTIVGSEFKTGTSGSYWRMGRSGASNVLENLPPYTPDPSAKLSGVESLAQGDTLHQGAGSGLRSGRILFAPGDSEAVMQVATSRSRATSTAPWGVEATVALVQADTVRLEGDHINITTEVGTDDSVNIAAKSVAVWGDTDVDITAPSVTINGTPMADTGWVECPYRSGFSTHATTGPIRARRLNGVVYLTGGVAGSGWPDNDEYVADLPGSDFWPDFLILTNGVSQNPLSAPARVYIYPTGGIRVLRNASADYTAVTSAFPA